MTPELVLLIEVLKCCQCGEGEDDCDVGVSLKAQVEVSASWCSSTEPVLLNEALIFCGEGEDDCDVGVSLEVWVDVSTSWSSSIASTTSITGSGTIASRIWASSS